MWWLLILLIILFALYLVCLSKAEGFTQGYNYLISGCIQKCELERLHNNPFYQTFEDGGYMTKAYCEQLCTSEYNKGNITGGKPYQGACMLRNPSYVEKPLKWCRYWMCPNKERKLVGSVKNVGPVDCKDSLYPL